MQSLAGFLTIVSLLQCAVALYELPTIPTWREEQYEDIFDGVVDESDVLKRSTSDATFPLDFNVKDQEIFNGNFEGVTLTVKCIECATTGQVVAAAMLPDLSDIDITDPGDIFDDSMLGLTFNGVGATINLDIAAEASKEITLPLFKTETPIGIAGPGFTVGVVFSVDIVLTITGTVDTQGGFKVAIPSGSSFMIPFDDAKPNVANFNGASASILPIKVDLPADITVALRLKAEAGVDLPDLKVIDARAVAGAFLSIPEVILKESATITPPPADGCVVPVSAEININAGVFVDIGADIGGIDLGGIDPTAKTTLFAAATSTCLKSVGAAANSTATATSASASATASGSSSGAPTLVRPTSVQTTLKTMCRPSSSVPSSFAVLPRTMFAKRAGYPITLESLATPITNYRTTAAAATAMPAISVVPVRA
ncbi:hypothetical protein F4777DRAFT_582571 [Nemania sp. FL0916]|nr:hypothetical protein F4777DRAFT_582571 [Nemania sp. FL0916]